MTQTLLRDLVAAIGPLERWSHQCHAASMAVLRSGLVEGRIARGWTVWVGGQHSWVVCSDDAYDRKAMIVDPTLWSYRRDIQGIWIGTYDDGLHQPHGGRGSIWEAGKPPTAADCNEKVIELADDHLSGAAKHFLEMCGPLGRTGWSFLAHAPVRGWPASEIIDAMYESEELRAIIPIDRVGMLTQRNPNGLYLVEAEES